MRFTSILILMVLMGNCFAQDRKPVGSTASQSPRIDVHLPQQPVKVVEIERAPPVAPVVQNTIQNEGPPWWVNLATAIAGIATVVAVLVAAKALRHSADSADASRLSAEAAAKSLEHSAMSAQAAKESVDEMRRQAAASRQPDVLAYLAFHEESDQLQVVIENFGGGPAKNVATTLPEGLDQDVNEEYYIYSAFSKKFAVMPPGYRFATPVGPPGQYRGNAKLSKPFTVNVSWEDLAGVAEKRELTLDVTAFVDAWSPRSNDAKLADSVGKLASEVSWFNRVQDAKLKGIKMTRGLGGSFLTSVPDEPKDNGGDVPSGGEAPNG